MKGQRPEQAGPIGCQFSSNGDHSFYNDRSPFMDIERASFDDLHVAKFLPFRCVQTVNCLRPRSLSLRGGLGHQQNLVQRDTGEEEMGCR